MVKEKYLKWFLRFPKYIIKNSCFSVHSYLFWNIGEREGCEEVERREERRKEKGRRKGRRGRRRKGGTIYHLAPYFASMFSNMKILFTKSRENIHILSPCKN